MSTHKRRSSGHLLALGIALCSLMVWSRSSREDPLAELRPLMERGSFEEALGAIEDLRASDRGGAEAVRLQAICLLALGEQPKAVRTLQEGISAHPTEHALSVLLADIYLSLGQPRLAIPVLMDARDGGASDFEISVTLAVCHGHSRSYERALEELERAERSGAPMVDVGYNRSLILLDEGRAGEARDILEEVLAERSDFLAALREHARALVMTAEGAEDERLVQAIAQVNQVLELETEDWRAYEVLGDAFLAQADPMAAIAAYTEALRFGHNPVQVEDKYREAAVRARREYGDAVDLPSVKPRSPLPPLPASMEGMEHLFRAHQG